MKYSLLLLLALMAATPARAAERIITLAPHLAELVCTAGACKKLVGTVQYSDYPAEAATRPLIGDALNLDFERITALQPDLVLAWDGGTPIETVIRLRQLGLRVESIRIHKLRDVAAALTRIGDLAHVQTAARFAANLYFHRLEKLRNANWTKNRLRVMYQIESGPVYTISARSPIHEALKLCGGDNVFGALQQVAPVVSSESVVAADPDVVLFAQQDDSQKIRNFWSQWPQAKAQRLGTLYPVNSKLLARQSPRLLDGVEQLCGVLDQARQQMASLPPSVPLLAAR